MSSVEEWEAWIWSLLDQGLDLPQGNDDAATLDPMEAVGLAAEMIGMHSAAADLLLIRIVAQMTHRATLLNLHSLLEYSAATQDWDRRPLMASQAKMLTRAISAIDGQESDVPFTSLVEARSTRETAMNLFPHLHQLAVAEGITALERVVGAIDGSTSRRTESARNAVFTALIEHRANINARTPLSPELISRLRDGPAFTTE